MKFLVKDFSLPCGGWWRFIRNVYITKQFYLQQTIKITSTNIVWNLLIYHMRGHFKSILLPNGEWKSPWLSRPTLLLVRISHHLHISQTLSNPYQSVLDIVELLMKNLRKCNRTRYFGGSRNFSTLHFEYCSTGKGCWENGQRVVPGELKQGLKANNSNNNNKWPGHAIQWQGKWKKTITFFLLENGVLFTKRKECEENAFWNARRWREVEIEKEENKNILL